MLVVVITQSQFHLYLAKSCYLARNSHPRGTPMLGGSAVKRDADYHPDNSGALFDSRLGLTNAIRQAYFWLLLDKQFSCFCV